MRRYGGGEGSAHSNVEDIAAGLFEGRGLKCLDLSENRFGDEFCFELSKHLDKKRIINRGAAGAEGGGATETPPPPRSKLKFLFLEGCGLTRLGNSDLAKVFRESRGSIFVWNEWRGVDCELGRLILDSYSRVFREFTFLRGHTPWFLRKLSITESFLDDEFCQDFASEFHNFGFLESIDLSGNQRITSVGKISLYLHMFDIRSDNAKLTKMSIQNSQTLEK